MMKKQTMNKNITLVVGAIVIAGLSFYGGIAYGKNGSGQTASLQGNFRGLGQGAAGAGGQRNGQNGGFTGGEILSKDNNSITVQLRDGSSKIVLVSSSTQVMKAAQGSLADLATGAQVTVMGSANADGSITAQTVQIRPAGAPLP